MSTGHNFEESLNEHLKDPEVAAEFIKEALLDPAEEGDDIGEQDRPYQRDQHQEYHDLDEVNGRTGEVVGIVALRHLA